MNKLIEGFISITLVIVLAFTGINLFGLAMQKRNAEVYHDKVVYEIESSDFSNVVISNAVASAQQNGYTLSVNQMAVVENKRAYEIKMDYTLLMPLLNVEKDGVITGYAR